MAVRLYGGTSADFLADAGGNWDGGGKYSVFADRALTTDITSTVTDKTGAAFPNGQPVADAVGLVEFTLPDSHTDFVWVATFDTVSEVWREPVRVGPADIPTRVATIETSGSGTSAALATETANRIAGDTALSTALTSKADLVGGTIPASQLPALAINDTFVVTSQAAMLALTAQRGDVAIRTDLSPAEAFILAADAPTVLANWKQITADAATLGAAQVYADAAVAAQHTLDNTSYGPVVGSDNWLKAWASNIDNLIRATTITRDANEAATGASVVWPDGSPGTYAATTVSTSFPGAVDAYTVTYGSPVTKTVTQPAVTRDAAGAVTVRPALTVA